MALLGHGPPFHRIIQTPVDDVTTPTQVGDAASLLPSISGKRSRQESSGEDLIVEQQHHRPANSMKGAPFWAVEMFNTLSTSLDGIDACLDRIDKRLSHALSLERTHNATRVTVKCIGGPPGPCDPQSPIPSPTFSFGC